MSTQASQAAIHSAAQQPPPFRADHVGSLLRPAYLKEAREQAERGEMTREQLRAVEDRAIREVVKLQEEVGLQSITDGEFRRAFWHADFARPTVKSTLWPGAASSLPSSKSRLAPASTKLPTP